MLLYNQGANPNGPFRLNSHPKAQKEIRKALRNPRFLASVDHELPAASELRQWGPPPQQSSGNATAALVLGICGLTVCPIICSILAIVFAKQAYTEIDNSGGRIGGRDAAKAGMILGWVSLALWGLGILAYIAFFVILFAVGESFDSYDDGSFDAIMPRFVR